MGKAVKRGNKWRVQVYDYTDANGKIHQKSFTANTKIDAEAMALEFERAKQFRTSLVTDDWTVKDAIDKYLDLRQGLSPTTIHAYEVMKEFAFQDIMNVKVKKIDDLVMQSAVNRERLRISPRTGKQISAKTLKNEYGLLSSALRTVCKRTYTIGKIECQKHLKEYPNPQDVIKALQGTDVELPCMLAIWLSFSMSEIRGLKCSDIRNGHITINRVKVEVGCDDLVKDDAKVSTRLRRRELPEYIMNLIENFPTYRAYKETGEDDFLIPWTRDKIYGRWQTICKENDLGTLSFHDLRHLFASTCNLLGISVATTELFGGWKRGSQVLQKVYTHSFNQEQIEADKKINAYFTEALEFHPTPSPKKPRMLKFQRFQAVK